MRNGWTRSFCPAQSRIHPWNAVKKLKFLFAYRNYERNTVQKSRTLWKCLQSWLQGFMHSVSKQIYFLMVVRVKRDKNSYFEISWSLSVRVLTALSVLQQSHSPSLTSLPESLGLIWRFPQCDCLPLHPPPLTQHVKSYEACSLKNPWRLQNTCQKDFQCYWWANSCASDDTGPQNLWFVIGNWSQTIKVRKNFRLCFSH